MRTDRPSIIRPSLFLLSLYLSSLFVAAFSSAVGEDDCQREEPPEPQSTGNMLDFAFVDDSMHDLSSKNHFRTPSTRTIKKKGLIRSERNRARKVAEATGEAMVRAIATAEELSSGSRLVYLQLFAEPADSAMSSYGAYVEAVLGEQLEEVRQQEKCEEMGKEYWRKMEDQVAGGKQGIAESLKKKVEEEEATEKGAIGEGEEKESRGGRERRMIEGAVCKFGGTCTQYSLQLISTAEIKLSNIERVHTVSI